MQKSIFLVGAFISLLSKYFIKQKIFKLALYEGRQSFWTDDVLIGSSLTEHCGATCHVSQIRGHTSSCTKQHKITHMHI